MTALKVQGLKVTLVDQVEQSLIDYFKERGLRPGDSLPNELELAETLGVARSVVREALSRFKMTGMIESRTRRGMVLSEPSLAHSLKKSINPLLMTEKTLFDLLEFRVVLEIGSTGSIFRNITDADIEELEAIVARSSKLGNNRYAAVSEYDFHTKLYEITGNRIVSDFQQIIHPVMEFIKDRRNDYFDSYAKKLTESGKAVTHEELLGYLKRRDRKGYEKAIRTHFKLYTDFMTEHKVAMTTTDEN